MVEIKPATQKDIQAYYGKRHKRTMRGIVAFVDGVPKGVAGLYYDGDKLVAFSDYEEELRAYPFLIYKAARKVLDMVSGSSCPVYSIANKNVPGSDALLLHLGFEHVDTCPEGEIYQWTPKQLPLV